VGRLGLVGVRRRRELARIAAPAAFLAGLTAAVLLIRAGLGGGGGSTITIPSVPTRAATVASTRTATGKHGTTSAAQYYTVQSGDTFGVIAARFGTTVQRLEQLNPGVSSNALSVGQRIRVK
jgi:LysM repeat protein